MSKSVFIGLNGPSRIGKTTMLNHLEQNYDVCKADPGDALKCFKRLSQDPDILKHLGNQYLEYDGDYEKLLSFVRVFKPKLLDDYEESKKYAGVREETIGFAELIRSIYPDFWVKAAKDLFYKEGKVGVGAIINEGELKELQNLYDVVIVVHLNCLNPASEVERDSRKLLAYGDYVSFEFTYKLEDSIKIADSVVKEYNLYGNLVNIPIIKEINNAN